MNLLKTLLASVVIMASMNVSGQIAVKSNLLYDATTTPNIGMEAAVGSKSTLNLVYGINPWKFDSETHGERKVKHWLVMPEYRWWTCSTFNGHFFGVHALGGQYNASNVSLPIPGKFFGGDDMHTGVRDHRYQGEFAGAGITYGYQWIMSKRWNIEAEVGVGYAHLWYDKYSCEDCVGKVASGSTNYAGITKIGLSLLYIF